METIIYKTLRYSILIIALFIITTSVLDIIKYSKHIQIIAWILFCLYYLLNIIFPFNKKNIEKN